MNEPALRAALLKLRDNDVLPSSRFTPAQRCALDGFARQTGALICQRQGRGDVYRVIDPVVFSTHLADLSPHADLSTEPDFPLRARHIALARDSKARGHQHACYHPIIKAIGHDVCWSDAQRGVVLPLSQLTRDFGAASLRIETQDAWSTAQALWLVENQALFDRTDWLAPDTTATLLYYGGQLNGLLLGWLVKRPRASRVIHFPDYDGAGLANFARLHALLGDACECWLMPDWSSKLARYGSSQLWRDTRRDFEACSLQLPGYLDLLTRQMRQSGLALEQEAVWLPGQ